MATGVLLREVLMAGVSLRVEKMTGVPHGVFVAGASPPPPDLSIFIPASLGGFVYFSEIFGCIIYISQLKIKNANFFKQSRSDMRCYSSHHCFICEHVTNILTF